VRGKAAPRNFKILAATEKGSKFPPKAVADDVRDEILRANTALIEAYASVGFKSELANLVVASIMGATLDGVWRNEIGFLAEFDIADAICYFGASSVSGIATTRSCVISEPAKYWK